MGMCRGCKQIFKTEDMIIGFCKNCQSSEEFINQYQLMQSKNQEKPKRKIKNKTEILTKSLAVLSAIYLLLVIIDKSRYRDFIIFLQDFLANCIPVILIFGIIWVYSAYSKNKLNDEE